MLLVRAKAALTLIATLSAVARDIDFVSVILGIFSPHL